MENRRLFIAFFLSALILIVWSTIFPPVPPAVQPSEQVATEAVEVADSETGSMKRLPATASREESDQDLIDYDRDLVEARVEALDVLEDESVQVVFSNRGAQMVSFRLKEHASAGGEALELVRDRGSDPYPFGLVVDGDKSHGLNSALFTSDRGRDDNGEEFIRFQHRSGRGSAEKIFRLTREGLVSVEITVQGSRGWSVILGPGLRNLSVEETENRFVQREVGYRRGKELETIGRTQKGSG